MDYQKIYNTIIERSRNRVLTEYSEEHHIIPRCLGGSNDKTNLVLLTPEEHYLCHLLLVKLNPNNMKLVKAAMFMVSSTKYVRRSNKMYGWLRRQYSDYMKGPNNPQKLNPRRGKDHHYYGKTRNSEEYLTDEGRKILSDSKLGDKNPMAGIKPWKHGRATEYTKSIWSNADKIYEVWLQNDKPSYCRLHSLVRGGMYDNKTVGPFMNLVKYFRNGWIPTEDLAWKELKEAI
jgi:hypothetical protein